MDLGKKNIYILKQYRDITMISRINFHYSPLVRNLSFAFLFFIELFILIEKEE